MGTLYDVYYYVLIQYDNWIITTPLSIKIDGFIIVIEAFRDRNWQKWLKILQNAHSGPVVASIPPFLNPKSDSLGLKPYSVFSTIHS